MFQNIILVLFSLLLLSSSAMSSETTEAAAVDKVRMTVNDLPELTPSTPKRLALLITPTMDVTCRIRAYPNIFKFMNDEAPSYPDLDIKQISILNDEKPRLVIFEEEKYRKAFTISGTEMTQEELLALLQATIAGQDSGKGVIAEVDVHSASVDEVKACLKAYNVVQEQKAEPEAHQEL